MRNRAQVKPTSVPRVLLLAALIPSIAFAQEVPGSDRRAAEVRHLDLTYSFPTYRTKAEWLARAEHLRKQILASAGLWPMPPRGALNAQVFGRVDRGDHTIEKVYFESLPGFFVTGNLYRPKKAAGKLPAVLLPHGHWTYGRLENTPLNSGPARAAAFARQGFVAFAHDMVGYNDSAAIGHRYGGEREALWGISVLGLQLWNSIRAVDFLVSLPEVDAGRLGCTGESGGGTQTFLLAAIDERIKVAAPVNMISAHMQGGDLCENAPNLRIDTSNVEFGAMMAPRPMLMVSATGDWTKNTLSVEYPAVRGVYRLFGAEDQVHAIQVDAPHNYNQESREAVYGWFAHFLQGRAGRDPIKEQSGGVAPLSDQLVFLGRPRPAGELDEAQLSAFLIKLAESQLAEAQPRDAGGLARFRESYGTALRYSLMAEYPEQDEVIAGPARVTKVAGLTKEELSLTRRGRGDRVAVTVWKPDRPSDPPSFVLEVRSGIDNPVDEKPELVPSRVAEFLRSGHTLIQIVPFAGAPPAPAGVKFLTTYNRTDDANRVQDILTALAYLNKRKGPGQLSVVADNEAAWWALLARSLAPAIDRMAVNVAGFDDASDEAFLKHLPIPGLRRAGDFATAVTVAPLTPLLVHNTGGRFRAGRIAEVYRRLGRGADFREHRDRLPDADLLAWLAPHPTKRITRNTRK